MSKPLRGYFPIMATPYTAGGEADLPSVERLVDYLIESGAHGMSPNGGDSEAPHLSVAERNAIIDVVVETNGGRTPVLAGTSAHTVEETLELNQHAQMAGADSIFVHPGWGRSGLSIEEVVDFYDRICREIEIPVMIHGTADMDLTVVGALLDRFPIITHIKEETSHGPKLRQYVESWGIGSPYSRPVCITLASSNGVLWVLCLAASHLEAMRAFSIFAMKAARTRRGSSGIAYCHYCFGAGTPPLGRRARSISNRWVFSRTPTAASRSLCPESTPAQRSVLAR